MQLTISKDASFAQIWLNPSFFFRLVWATAIGYTLALNHPPLLVTIFSVFYRNQSESEKNVKVFARLSFCSALFLRQVQIFARQRDKFSTLERKINKIA